MILKCNKMLLICYVAIIGQACTGQVKVEKKNPTISNGSNIPTIQVNNDDSALAKMKGDIESELGIGSLREGSQDLQIRIWKGYPHTDYLQLSIFTKSGKDWSAQLYNLVLHYNSTFDSIVGITKDVIIKDPCSGWQFFIDSLMKLNIADLPDDSKIPNYYKYVNMDAGMVTIEILTAGKYRIYRYSDVESASKAIDEAKKVSQILKLIQMEF